MERNNSTSTPWKLSGLAALALAGGIAMTSSLQAQGGPDVAILGAQGSFAPRNLDIREKLEGTGEFSKVDVINLSNVTPDLPLLQCYDAVLVYSNFSYMDPVALGDLLADYYDAGGGVVSMLFETTGDGPTILTGLDMEGRWLTDGYQIIPRTGDVRDLGAETLGTVHVPGNPIMSGVTSFNGGFSSYRPVGTTLLNGGTLIAEWSDGKPLVTELQKGAAGYVVDLGFYPISSDIHTDFWQVNTDGAQLMANALLRAIDGRTHAPCPHGWIGDFVWLDQDKDGIQDPGEPGVDGVEVQLVSNLAGTTIATTYTTGGGLYAFNDLVQGSYYVRFIAPGNPGDYAFSARKQGGNTALDSDCNAGGRVPNFILAPGQSKDDIDAGLIDLLPPSLLCGGLSIVGPSIRTSLDTITYTALFSEDVVNVESAIDLSGSSTPGSLSANVIPGAGPDDSYVIEVSGMTGPGDVVLAFTPGVIEDLGGNDFDVTGVTGTVTIIDLSVQQIGRRVAAFDQFQDDKFGNSVSISGQFAIVGAPTDDDNSMPSSGSAYVFERDQTGSWTLKQKLTASNPAPYDVFGEAVAIDGDLAVVGAPYADNPGQDAGRAYVFQRDTNGVWSEIDQLNAFNPLKPADSGIYYRFGSSVDISAGRIIVGAPLAKRITTPAGLAYIYDFDSCDSTFTQTALIWASDGASYDDFGRSVAIDGNRVLVGSRRDSTPVASYTGSGYYFEFNGSDWIETQKLIPTTGARADYFGTSCALDGNLLALGAPSDDGAFVDSGSVQGYWYNGATWVEIPKTVQLDPGQSDQFGTSVGISGNYLIVGSPMDDDFGSNSGSAYVFEYVSGVFTQIRKWTADDHSASDQYGLSVSISENSTLVGAPWGNDSHPEDPINNVGTAYFNRLDQVVP